jgi:hypothetical protein
MTLDLVVEPASPGGRRAVAAFLERHIAFNAHRPHSGAADDGYVTAAISFSHAP